MTAPRVTIKEQDIAVRVPSFPGLYIGIVLPDAKKGLVGDAVLNTTGGQLLDRYTVNSTLEVGMDNAYFSALAVLQKSNKLWTVRPNQVGMLYGGVAIEPSGITGSAPFTTGTVTQNAYTFGTNSCAIVGASPGSFCNNLRISVYNYKSVESVVATPSTGTTNPNSLTVTQNWGLGYPVRLSTSGVLPTGLNTGSTYFIIPTAPGIVKLAASLSDAAASVPVAIVLGSAGTGTHNIRPAIIYAPIPGTFLVNVYKSTDLNNAIESKICSKGSAAKDGNGNNIYLQNVFASSNNISMIDNALVSDTYLADIIIPIALGGGLDGQPNSDSDCINALASLASTDKSLTLILDGGRTTASYQQAIISVCETRRDCVGIICSPFSAEDSSDYLNAVVDYRNITLNANTSFAAMYSSHVLITDQYNARDLYVSPDGFVGALISETAANYEIWYPVAGFRRGILNVKDVRRRWSDGEMDYLYDNGINPIRFAAGRGIVIWGQKTLQKVPSPLDRLNVRFMLVVVEPAVKQAMDDFLFEINDATTRADAKATVDAEMLDIQARRGVYAFSVICDSSNNTAEDTANNRMNITVNVQPTQSAEEIPVTFIVTPTGTTLNATQSIA